jgi:hypothetical protein
MLLPEKPWCPVSLLEIPVTVEHLTNIHKALGSFPSTGKGEKNSNYEMMDIWIC